MGIWINVSLVFEADACECEGEVSSIYLAETMEGNIPDDNHRSMFHQTSGWTASCSREKPSGKSSTDLDVVMIGHDALW